MDACAVVEKGLPVLVGWVNILCAESGWDEYHERMGGDSVGRGWLQVDRGAKHLRKAGGDGLTDFAVALDRDTRYRVHNDCVYRHR